MNVLFIEDDPMNRRVVRDMLDVAGATMTEAEDGPAGLAAIGAADFQMVLVSAWRNDSNTASCCAGTMPMPVSATAMRTPSPVASARKVTLP